MATKKPGPVTLTRQPLKKNTVTLDAETMRVLKLLYGNISHGIRQVTREIARIKKIPMDD